MNAGVSSAPWGVSSRPRRAPEPGSLVKLVKVSRPLSVVHCPFVRRPERTCAVFAGLAHAREPERKNPPCPPFVRGRKETARLSFSPLTKGGQGGSRVQLER